MHSVNWNGMPLEHAKPNLPANLRETIFDYLPPPVPMTPVMEEMAETYLSGKWITGEQITGEQSAPMKGITPELYAPMQAAHFIQPQSHERHLKRRNTFHQRAEEAEADGFVVPDVFRQYVETDAYVDRVHHNTIWLEMPTELMRLPSDPSCLVFLTFSEGGGFCYWHLLLGPDGSHCMVAGKHPFGLPEVWPNGHVPDYSKWKVNRCADSIEEWLYHYFLDSAEHDRHYIERLRPYHPEGWTGY